MPQPKIERFFPGLNSHGVALTIAAVVIVMLAILAAIMTQLGASQRKLADTASGVRARIYYLAQGGTVDAFWRIRTDYTTGLNPAGSFLNDAYDPAPYPLDVNGDGINDTCVDIDRVDPAYAATTKQRSVSSTGYQDTVGC